jgi:hypothetical protein
MLYDDSMLGLGMGKLEQKRFEMAIHPPRGTLQPPFETQKSGRHFLGETFWGRLGKSSILSVLCASSITKWLPGGSATSL